MCQCHTITQRIVIGNIIPLGIIAVFALLFGEHNTTAALTIDDIKESNTQLFEFITDSFALCCPIILSGKKGIILLFVQNLTNIFRNSHFHDITIQMKLAIDIHRGSLPDIDIRCYYTVREILNEGCAILSCQKT